MTGHRLPEPGPRRRLATGLVLIAAAWGLQELGLRYLAPVPDVIEHDPTPAPATAAPTETDPAA